MTVFHKNETRPFTFGYGPAVLQYAEYTNAPTGTAPVDRWQVSGAVGTTTSVKFLGNENAGRKIKLTITVGNTPKFVNAEIV